MISHSRVTGYHELPNTHISPNLKRLYSPKRKNLVLFVPYIRVKFKTTYSLFFPISNDVIYDWLSFCLDNSQRVRKV